MNRNAFSLVELSIVLVILGLLTGGILAGQSLIRASELRAVGTEYNRWLTASQTFRDKYFALPGDMTNATKFWTAPAACPGTAGTGTQTCDGNGDGMVQTTAPAANNYSEVYTFWQHMANAGLVEGSYNGRSGATNSNDATVDNSPRSKFPQGMWFPINWNQQFTSTAMFDGNYRENILQFGALSVGGSPANPVIRAEEAWNIDTKMDDGRPAYGSVRARFWATPCTTATASTQLTADYLLTNTTNGCVLLFTIR